MFRLIGSFIDNFILIAAGIYLLLNLKRFNKSYFKWLAILLIIIGVLLSIIDIIELSG
jgi:membrane protein DedA with SNARE-associated domain